MAGESGGIQSNGAGITVVVGLFAIIAGVYSMIEPLGQRMDFMSDQIADIRGNLTSDNDRERLDRGAISTLEERCRALEIQFQSLVHKQETDMARHAEESDNMLATTDKITELRRKRARDEHRAMMREDALRIDYLEHRLCVLEPKCREVIKSETGEWERLFSDDIPE